MKRINARRAPNLFIKHGLKPVMARPEYSSGACCILGAMAKDAGLPQGNTDTSMKRLKSLGFSSEYLKGLYQGWDCHKTFLDGEDSAEYELGFIDGRMAARFCYRRKALVS